MKKLLLIGSNAGNVHLKNFLDLVNFYFDEVLVVSDHEVNFAPHRFVSFSLKNPIKVWQNIKSLRKIIHSFQPTIIHVHQANSYAFITGIALRGNIPLVVTAWGSDVLLLPKKSMFHRWLVQKSLLRAQAVTVDSVAMKQEAEALSPNSVIWQANFGVDVDVNEVLDPNRENICYSNRMHEPLYQIQKILDSFLAMQGKITMKLILGGKGSLHDTFLKFIETHKLQDSIEIVGFVDKEANKKNYLRSKFFLSIPTSDGTSISLLEAMAYGCIPILSNLDSNKDWVEDGINGILVQEYESVEEAIHRGMLLDAGKVQARNREIIAQRATKAANARIFLEIYDKLLASDTEAKR